MAVPREERAFLGGSKHDPRREAGEVHALGAVVVEEEGLGTAGEFARNQRRLGLGLLVA